MLKKSLTILSIFCIITLASSLVFASNIMQVAENAVRDVGNGIEALVDDAGNAMQDAGNGISNMMNDWNRDAENTENDMTNNDMGTTTMEDGTGDGYTATRTGSVEGAVNTNNAFVWTILAVAAAIIIALVWYYATQTSDTNNNHYR